MPADRLQKFRNFQITQGSWDEFARHQDGALVGAAVAQRVIAEIAGADPLTELGVAHTVQATAEGLVFVGPSRPIRDAELTLQAARVHANRGANGIDGVVSSAIGAALADQAIGGGPAVALLGDLTYLHDRNGLLLGPDEPRVEVLQAALARADRADDEATRARLEALLGHFCDPAVSLVAPRIVGLSQSDDLVTRYEAVRSSLDLGLREAPVVPYGTVSYVPRAAIVCRRSALTSVGGFDETMQSGEDVDLCWRLIEAGTRLRYEPIAHVAHDHRTAPTTPG